MTKRFLALGSSHTAGVGLSTGQIYVDQLAADLKLDCDNRSVPGGSSRECVINLVTALREYRPEFVIAQWPPIFRRTLWIGDRKIMQTVTSEREQSFSLLLKLGTQNFSQPWIQDVLIADTLARSQHLDIYHIWLDSPAAEIDEISAHGITVHCDEKLPGRSWLFDNACGDGTHHSAACHRSWADRLRNLIVEDSPR